MLFDLRSPGRRRVVKTVYVFLALLIGVGLVGFGVGTGGSFGGIFNAASSGGGSASGQVLLENSLKKAQKRARAHPNSAAAWLAVGQAAYQIATLPTNYNASVGYGPAGHAALDTVKQAWNNYMGTAPSQPNNIFAEEVAAAFASPPSGIGDYTTAESAQAVVTENDPNSDPKKYSQYEYLAYYAYLAKDLTGGNLASARALALAPKAQVKQLRTTLLAIKAQAEASAGATGATGATG